jgi:hypothetical protein
MQDSRSPIAPIHEVLQLLDKQGSMELKAPTKNHKKEILKGLF